MFFLPFSISNAVEQFFFGVWLDRLNNGIRWKSFDEKQVMQHRQHEQQHCWATKPQQHCLFQFDRE
jgi:hypothetical protein